MSTQTFANHRQVVPAFHLIMLPVLLLTLIGSVVNLVMSWGDHERLYSAALIIVLTICLMMTAILGRVFALKAQDRAIRAEENLRHFVMTGKLLDPRLGIRQVIGLRFAPDGEFVALAQRAADKGMTESEIKKAVNHWRADEYRA